MNATALIAEDEPLLATALQAELALAWPQLRIVATVGHGAAAVQQALALRPDVVFLDIRMPLLTGLEVAAELAEEWPVESAPFPALVFVTAYDQYAVQAFEAQALDYLLKPVQAERLAKTVQRVQALVAQRRETAARSSTSDPALDPTMDLTLDKLRALLAPATAAPPLKVIQAGVGTQIRLLPVDQVLCFEAADKYVRVLTQDAELLIRTPLKELLPQLDASEFWQIHRSTVVRAHAIHSVHRDETGKLSLQLRGLTERLPVSRLYAARFKAM